ncbi:protein-tyrosine phosphatase-like protein [Globomyces pollinis-pini]|nr:protein-tyrosine phosphatase-like protein [Globomyces pollinis-pini]
MQSHSLVSSPFLKNISFLITDCPQINKLLDYSNLLIQYNVNTLIRISEPIYDTTLLSNNNIIVFESYFEDGSTPSKLLLSNYFQLLDNISKNNNSNQICIAIHCVSGIGRAPLLVCCALIRAGMDRLDSVEFIRKHRRGAINRKQLDWLTDSKNGFKLQKNSLFSSFFKKK